MINKLKAHQANPENNNRAIEKKSIERIFEIIDKKQDSNNIEIKVVGLEGCHVDTCVRFKGSNDDIWLPIQNKASNTKKSEFDIKRYKCPDNSKDEYERFGYYENMLTICHNMKIDEFLVIPPHSNENKKIPNTTLSYSSGVNKEFGVKKEDIYEILLLFSKNRIITLSTEVIDVTLEDQKINND